MPDMWKPLLKTQQEQRLLLQGMQAVREEGKGMNNDQKPADVKVLSGEVLETRDMSIFRKLNGNREVSERRIWKIEKSLGKIGWIKPTVIVNEKMEVIDGQGRIEVAKKHGLPVKYEVIPGIGIDECIAMNIDQTNWKMDDFCRSWKDQGNENYARLCILLDSFNDYSFTVVCCAATGLSSVPAKIVKEGRMVCSDKQMEQAINALTYLNRFKEVFDSMGSATGSRFQMALLFVYTMGSVDLERVVKRVCANEFRKTDSFPNIHTTLLKIEDLYNYRLSADKHVFFASEYKRAQSAKCGWYERKWGWKIAEAVDGREQR